MLERGAVENLAAAIGAEEEFRGFSTASHQG